MRVASRKSGSIGGMSGRLTSETVQIAPAAAVNGRVTDEDRIGQRRQLGRNLQTMRERLTSASGLERSFETELLRQFAEKATRTSSAILAVLTVTVASIATIWLRPDFIGIWALTGLLTCALSFVISRRLLATMEEATKGTRRALVVLTALQAAVWAGLVLMFLGVPEPAAKVFVVSALMFYGSVVVMSTYTVPLAVYLAIGPLALALSLFVFVDRDMGMITIAGVGMIGQAFFLFLANRLYSQAVATLEFRARPRIPTSRNRSSSPL